jgi:fatty acid desaturase
LTRGFAAPILSSVIGEPPQPPTPSRVEWVTVGLIALWAAAMAAVVLAHESIPWFVVVPALALLSAFQFSLQHEAIHGHPTPWRWLNVALVGLPFALWCPYREYRISHLRHHASALTVPGVDPESYHVTAQTWAASGRFRRRLLRANRTLAGRLLIGPVLVIAGTARRAVSDVRLPAVRRMWCGHLLLAGATLVMVVGVAGLPLWEYLVGIVWGGTSLTLLRSFAEHRAEAGAVGPSAASAVVRSNRFFSLLFLNNNLHLTHHARPGAAWYLLPHLHERLGSDEVARMGAGWYRGYGEIARRYLVRPFGEPVHPDEGGPVARVPGRSSVDTHRPGLTMR